MQHPYISAVVILAPYHVQKIAVPLMRQYSHESLMRIPAHITVLFPFVPLNDLDAAAQKLRGLFSDNQSFDVTLDGYGYFPRTTYMRPLYPSPIKALFRQIHAVFPEYPPYRGAFGDDEITPHMTVGEFATEADRQQAVFPAYAPLTFSVRCLHLVVGVEHEPVPWITHDVIPLGRKS